MKIVDLSIEDDCDVPVLRVHGLVATRHIDNRKPAMSQSNATIKMKPVTIGAECITSQ